MIKRGLVLAIALMAVPGLAAAGDDRAELGKMLDEFLWGASIGSAQAHRDFWADDLVYTSSRGTRTSKAEILSGMEGAPEPDPETKPELVYTAEDADIRVFGDAAVVAFKLVGTTQADGSRQEYFNTGTLLKRDGQWRVIAWQATIIPEPEPEE